MTRDKRQIEHRLQLPQRRELKSRRCKASFYGAISTLAKYCGVRVFDSDPPLCWQHGVRISDFPSASWILGDELEYNYTRYFVKNDEDAEELGGYGIHAEVTGLPIIYARTPTVSRIPNSLLVMPAHSLAYTKHNWKFDEYAQQVGKLRNDFDEIVACIHPSCWKKGYWVDALQAQGITCINGADSYDANALQRMATLFAQFETMMTNTWGSHIPYAAAFGVKTCVFGDFATYEKEDFTHSRFYQERPELLEFVVGESREAAITSRFPWLFNHPSKASIKQTWGRDAIGWPNRRTPEQIKSLLGWSAMSQAVHAGKQIQKFAQASFKQIVNHSRKLRA